MEYGIILQLSLFIFGTVFGIFIKYIFELYKISNEKLLLFKIDKYIKIIEYMYFSIENIDTIPFISNKKNKMDYQDLLYKEYFESFTYGHKKVIGAYEKFLEVPNHNNFINFIMNVRNDLWRIGGLKGVRLSQSAMMKIFKSQF